MATIPSGTTSTTFNITQSGDYLLAAGETRTQTANIAISGAVTSGSATVDIEGSLINTASALNSSTGVRSGRQAISGAFGNQGLITIGANGQVKTTDATAIIGTTNANTYALSITNLGQVISQTSNATIATSGNRGASGFAISLNAMLGDPNGGADDVTSGGILTNGSTGNTTALIRSDSGDAVRLGAHQTLNNYGLIEGAGQVNDAATNNVFAGKSTTNRYDNSRGVRINNEASKDVQINNFGTIRGSQHGVDVGEDEVFGVRIDNKAGALIEGRNGSGVGADTAGDEANTVVVTNAGTIRGGYNPKFDRAGYATIDGDGDGVDVDGGATITNLAGGLIEGTGAGGFDSGGRANASEGISIGGGIVVNSGIIRGANTGIVVNNDGNADRSGVAATAITNYATGSITGQGGYAIRLENKEPANPAPGADPISDDTIVNFGTITGSGAEPDSATVLRQDGVADPNSVGTLDGVTYSASDAGNARFIRGDGSVIQMGEGDDTLDNYGSIVATTGARAVNMEGGDDTLTLHTGSTVTGRIDGGAGDDDTLNLRLDDRTGGTGSNEGANSGATTGTLTNVTRFETLTVSGGTWTLGDDQAYVTATVADAALKVEADLDADVTVEDGGTLTGSGSTGALSVESGGTLSGGDAVGKLETGALTLASGATLEVAIGGSGDGEYDQLVVTGAVDLGGATLEAAFAGNFRPDAEDSLTIIDNDGSDAVSGTFVDDEGNALAEGATVTVGDRDFTISYEGGDGNDVTLTAQNVAPTALDDMIDVLQRTSESGNVIVEAGDTDIDGGTLSVAQVSFGATTTDIDENDTTIAGSYGTLTIDPDGSYSYDADVEGRIAVGESATDTFTYTISDGQGGTASADLTVTVTGSAFGNGDRNVFLLTGRGTSATGYGGNDTYYVDAASDRVNESADGGTDTIFASADYTLRAGVSVEYLRADAGTTGITLTGNALAQRLFSGAGDDTLIGGDGSDIYYVNGANDVVREGDGGGSDTVYAGVDYTLGADQAIETLRANAGMTGLALTGNALGQAIFGGAGEDTLDGGAGNDRLDGGLGDDTLIGGAGDDRYYVDAGDTVQETGGGTDTVYAGADFTIADGQAIEILRANAGSAGLELTGNGLAQSIYGGAGADRLNGGGGDDLLSGGAGNDTMIGGAGADRYYVDVTGDIVLEAEGGETDTVYAGSDYTLASGQGIEILRANAGATGLTLTGNDLAQSVYGGAGGDTLDGAGGRDTLSGGGGGDTLIGGLGRDQLTGGAGADTFVFRSLSDSAVGANRDYITDFRQGGEDVIDLSAIDADTTVGGDQAFTFIGGAAFAVGQAGQLHQIRSGSSTVIEGDVDGNGVADFQIQLKGTLTLTADDFLL